MENAKQETTGGATTSKETKASRRRSETYRKYNQSSKGIERKKRYKLKQQMKKQELTINVSINGQTILKTSQQSLKSDSKLAQFWRDFVNAGQMFAQDSEVGRHLCELREVKDAEGQGGSPSKRAKIAISDATELDQSSSALRGIHTLSQVIATESPSPTPLSNGNSFHLSSPSSSPHSSSSSSSSPPPSLLSFPTDSTLTRPRVHTPSIPAPYVQAYSFYQLPIMNNTHGHVLQTSGGPTTSSTNGILPSFSPAPPFLGHPAIITTSNSLPVQLPSASSIFPSHFIYNTAVDNNKPKFRPLSTPDPCPND